MRLCAAAVTVAATIAFSTEMPAPPRTPVHDVTEVLHGHRITDPYRWLEDQNSPETRAWIEAQNKYTQSFLTKIPGRDEVRELLTSLNRVDTITAPAERGGRYFFLRRAAGQDQFVLYVRNGRDGRDEVLVDPNPLSPDHSTSVSMSDISRDGSMIIYEMRHGGEDEVVPYIMDMTTRKVLPDRLPKARYFISLKPDKTGFYYSNLDALGSRLRYHAIGTDAKDDVELLASRNPSEILTGEVSLSGRYLVISRATGSSADSVDIYVKDLANNGPIRSVVEGLHARFEPVLAGDTLYLKTNWNAPRGHVYRVDPERTARENWTEVIPQGEYVLEGVSPVGGHLALSYLKNVSTEIRISDADGKPVRDVTLPQIGTASAPSGRWDSSEAFYQFTTFTENRIIYRYDVASGAQEVWARVKTPFDVSQVETKQVWFESRDKTRVPMFIVHPRGIRLDGSHPVLLTGYGGFNVSNAPAFSTVATAWVAKGGVFAVANLRGGGEFGEEWHKAGMLERKQNVFDDFIGAAEYLVREGYTRPAHLGILGGSNGGLLVGAAVTQRPDLFGAAICAVPLLDMVRYQMFKIAKLWTSEYGSSEDPKQLEYILKYSPYQNVKPGTKYPALLFMSGDSDTRVDPLHARKMTAMMQAANTSGRPILLYYETAAGHSNGLPLSRQIERSADELAFLWWQLTQPGSAPETQRSAAVR